MIRKLLVVLLLAGKVLADDFPDAQIKECNSAQFVLGPLTGVNGVTPVTPEIFDVSLDVLVAAVHATPQPTVNLWTGHFVAGDIHVCPTPIPPAVAFPAGSLCLVTTAPPEVFRTLPVGRDTTAIASYLWGWHDGADKWQQGYRWQRVLIYARPNSALGCPAATPTPP